MSSFAHSRIVVVAGGETGCRLADRLSRMTLKGVRVVPSLEDARRLCEAACVDACLVVIPSAKPDDVSGIDMETDAPGCRAAIPSLLVADVVTPHVMRTARNSGYAAVLPADAPPRLLYRHLGALLQLGASLQRSRRVAGRGRPMRLRRSLRADSLFPGARSESGKLKLQ